MGYEPNEGDIRIDTFTGGPRSPVSVRVTHIPTGIWAEATGFMRIKTREDAMAKLRELLAARTVP